MAEVTDLSSAREDRAIGVMKRRIGGQDGLSDHALTGGTWIDAMSSGLPVQAICEAFMQSDSSADFEARVYVEMERANMTPFRWRDDDTAEQIKAVLDTFD
jgi:hypothetical protein